MKKAQKANRETIYQQQNNYINISHSNINISNSGNTINNANYNIPNRIDRESSPFVLQNNHNYPILNEINKNARKKPNGRRWSPFAIGFFVLLFYVSAAAYRLVQNNLPIPAESTIHLHAQKFFSDNSQSILNINDLPSLLYSYRKHTKQSNYTLIEGIIAVDAVSLYPSHKFTDNESISGFINFENLTIKNSEEIKQSYSIFENLIFNHSNKTVKSAFVFQFHPIDVNLPVFLVHLFPWINGKANPQIEQIMFKVGQLMNKIFFKIIGYAFDGDSSYRHNLENIDKNFDYSKGNKFQKIDGPLFFSDYLHILKRARYRLLKRINFYYNNNNEIKKKLAEEYNLPYVVFSDEKITKMHDSLAIKLFNLRVLLLSENKNSTNFYSFLFPFTMMHIALNYQNISLQERIDLLQISLKYLSYFPNKMFFNGNMFHSQLLIDSRGTLISLLNFIFNNYGKFSINRLSSNPLEHSFGTLRMKARYDDTIDKFIECIKKLNFIRLKRRIYQEEVIYNRVSDYGRVIDLNSTKNEYLNYVDSVVKSVLTFSLNGIKDPIFVNFNKKLQEIMNNNNNKCKVCIKSSKDFYLNPGTTLRINSRQQNDNNQCSPKRCKWTSYEDELLKNSYDFTKGNITQLMMIFNNRTPNSIRARISYLRRNNKLN